MNLNADTPGGLPEFALDLDPARLDFSGNGDFWARVQALVADGDLGTHLDACLSGHSAPRVWTFLFDEGQAGLALTAAFSMAAALCQRDQSVLVLDGDDHQSLLTRLSGRHESHGWIDMARYGASILTCGDDLPFEGRRGHLLGVGSFAPTDISAEEVADLLTRLRRQADDILILAPLDPTGRLWNEAADIRLLCRDRARMGQDRLTQLVDGLGTESLVGLVTTGTVVDTAPVTEAAAGVVDPPPESPAPDRAVPEQAEVSDPPDEIPEVPAEPEAVPLEPVASNMAAILAAAEADEASGEAPPPIPGEGQRTSRIFWGAAVVSVVIILAVSVYWLKFLRVPEEGYFESVVPGRSLSDVGTEGGATENLTVDADLPPTTETALAGPDTAAADTTGAVQTAAAEVDTQPAPPPPVEIPVETTVTADPVTPETDPEPAGAGPVFSMTPYEVPVGTEPWAIHVYSLPDSAAADKEIARLERRGFTTGLKIVEVPDKGRWYRLYLGSFPDKAAAREAMPLLLEKLGETWAQVRPYTDTR